jgi:pyruvate-formate lyase
MLRSVAKSDHGLISNGCAVNMKLNPQMLHGEERLGKAIDLIKGYFDLGGMELQINCLSDRILRDAQKHPDRYRDLVVRVSGYSAYFLDLGKPLQDEIIRRIEFDRL